MPPQNRSAIPLGTLLEGKFRLTREIGRGGMATVYEALNVDIGKRVAVKVLAQELITSRIVRERFLREARAAAAIRSPYICDVYDSGMYDERPFLVMELLEGESLYDNMTRVRRLDTATTLRIVTHTARGLAKAHEANVVHRDLKPENIFLVENEEGEMVAKIVDFGLAKFYEPNFGEERHVRLTREGALFGTPAYMSPEQAKGQGEVDHRADLWALGCIVYECLTGQTVWNVDQGVAMILAQIASSPLPRPSKLRPDVPPNFDDWFVKALARDPKDRFQSAREFADSLAEVLGPPSTSHDELPRSQPSHVSPMSTPQPAAPESGSGASPQEDRSRASRAISLLVAIALVVLGGYGTLLYALYPPHSAQELPPANASPAASAPTAPLETESYALQIGAAQEWLGKGDPDNAVKMLREALQNGGSGVARSLLGHAEVAARALKEGSPCRVIALGRPRPFEITTPASPPTLALTADGVVVSWVDDHQDAAQQAYLVQVDEFLRRVSPARSISPEASKAQDARLLNTTSGLVALHHDSGGSDSGIFIRKLGSDGRIASPTQKVSAEDRRTASPAVTEAEDGTLWVVWVEEIQSTVRDVMVRHLNAQLEPMSPPVRLTRLARSAGVPGARTPEIAVAHGHVNIVYALERRQSREIVIQRISLVDPALQRGLPKDPLGDASEDLHVGQYQILSGKRFSAARPRIACSTDGCFVAWDDDRAGALAAFVDPKGEKLWHREFAARGSRPSLAVARTGEAAIVWFESRKFLQLASLNRDGLTGQSILASVTGFQPNAELVPSDQPGGWFVAWRDFEAGHHEAFVLQTQCQ